MKGCIGILARLGSQRLPEKHLIDICGKPAIAWLVERIQQHFAEELENGDIAIRILTGNREENKPLGDYASRAGIQVFYGDEDNIPRRILDALQQYADDYYISIDGDDILCSVESMRQVFEAMQEGEAYAGTRGYPFGMNAFGFSTALLEKALASTHHAIIETGWTWIFDELAEMKWLDEPRQWDQRLRFTLDYPEDLQFFEALLCDGIDVMQASYNEICNHVLENGLYQHNIDIINAYWENFNKRKTTEKEGNN